VYTTLDELIARPDNHPLTDEVYTAELRSEAARLLAAAATELG
jgi:hypothetical protein